MNITTKYFLLLLSLLVLFACKNKSESEIQNKNIEKDIINDENSATSIPVTKRKNIIFFGNSLTAGYGLEEDQSFPSLIQDRIDSLKLPYHVVNAGVSGETTADGKSRIDWVLKQHVDIFVLELGANDVLRGLDIRQSEENLRNILKAVKNKYPEVKIVIAGMQAPTNMGNSYTKTFASIYPRLAKEFDAALIPFLLTDVATIPSLNLPDGKHPNATGQKIVRDNVWKMLEPLL